MHFVVNQTNRQFSAKDICLFDNGLVQPSVINKQPQDSFSFSFFSFFWLSLQMKLEHPMMTHSVNYILSVTAHLTESSVF